MTHYMTLYMTHDTVCHKLECFFHRDFNLNYLQVTVLTPIKGKAPEVSRYVSRCVHLNSALNYFRQLQCWMTLFSDPIGKNRVIKSD